MGVHASIQALTQDRKVPRLVKATTAFPQASAFVRHARDFSSSVTGPRFMHRLQQSLFVFLDNRSPSLHAVVLPGDFSGFQDSPKWSRFAPSYQNGPLKM